MKATSQPPGRAGFTLTEVLVVITIIALLFSMVMGGFSFAQRSASTSRTQTTMAAMRSALERYNTDFGEYPEPANPGDTVQIVKTSYEVSGAAMLYQALSGDGTDQIKISSSGAEGSVPSNGSLDDNEGANVKMTDMPKEIWAVNNDRYYMVDGFGKPYQYTKALPPTDSNGQPQQPITINNTYDLWSYGADDENSTARSLDSTTDSTLKAASAKWIRNW